MKSHLLWDRFLSHWLPPEKVTGKVERDVDEALRATYDVDGKGHTFSQKGGLSTIVVTEAATRVASRIPPRAAPCDRPNWLVWVGPLSGKEHAELRDAAVRDLIAAPRPHVIVRTGKRPLTLDEILLGDGTAMVVNEPDKTTVTDSVRVARARRALKVLGTVNRAGNARRMLDDRLAATGDTDAIDRKIRTMIRKLRVDAETFFDAIDLLDGVSGWELKLAGDSP